MAENVTVLHPYNNDLSSENPRAVSQLLPIAHVFLFFLANTHFFCLALKQKEEIIAIKELL